MQELAGLCIILTQGLDTRIMKLVLLCRLLSGIVGMLVFEEAPLTLRAFNNKVIISFE